MILECEAFQIFCPRLNFQTFEMFPVIIVFLIIHVLPAFVGKYEKYGKLFVMTGPRLSVFWTFRTRNSLQCKVLGRKMTFCALTTITPAVDSQQARLTLPGNIGRIYRLFPWQHNGSTLLCSQHLIAT